MKIDQRNSVRKLLLIGFYLLGLLGIVACGGSGGDSEEPPTIETCLLDSAKIGECKIQ